jgi:phage FluMu gp28-like protein
LTESQNDYFQNLKRAIEFIFDKMLFPFQRKFVLDDHRFKIAVKARQIGFSLCLALEAAILVLLFKQPVYFISRTEKQSIYLLEKFYRWIQFFQESGVNIDFLHQSRTECNINGVDVKSLTSMAVAGEGFTGNVFIDEFSLQDNDVQIYESLLPSISWGYKIRIIGRAFGQSNLHYAIYTDTDRFPDYHRYKVDIYDAVKEGLPVDVKEIKRNFTDEGFRENYLCEFIDESSSYFSYKLIRNCIGEELSGEGEDYLGVDIARQRHNTIVHVLRKLGNRWTIKRAEEMSAETFEDQEKVIRQVLHEFQVKSGGMDATGLGSQLSERINKDFPQVAGVVFNDEVKEKIVTTVKKAFEDGNIVIPDDPNLIADIHAIRKKITKHNNILFDAVATKDGHADRFWALGLAMYSSLEDDTPFVRIYTR